MKTITNSGDFTESSIRISSLAYEIFVVFDMSTIQRKKCGVHYSVLVYTQLASIIIGIIIMVLTTPSIPFNVDKQQVTHNILIFSIKPDPRNLSLIQI
jgi:hypothetical protein